VLEAAGHSGTVGVNELFLLKDDGSVWSVSEAGVATRIAGISKGVRLVSGELSLYAGGAIIKTRVLESDGRVFELRGASQPVLIKDSGGAVDVTTHAYGSTAMTLTDDGHATMLKYDTTAPFSFAPISIGQPLRITGISAAREDRADNFADARSPSREGQTFYTTEDGLVWYWSIVKGLVGAQQTTEADHHGVPLPLGEKVAGVSTGCILTESGKAFVTDVAIDSGLSNIRAPRVLPDFNIFPVETSVGFAPGEKKLVAFKVVRVNGSAGPLTVTPRNVPAGYRIAPVTVEANATMVNIEVERLAGTSDAPSSVEFDVVSGAERRVGGVLNLQAPAGNFAVSNATTMANCLGEMHWVKADGTVWKWSDAQAKQVMGLSDAKWIGGSYPACLVVDGQAKVFWWTSPVITPQQRSDIADARYPAGQYVLLQSGELHNIATGQRTFCGSDSADRTMITDFGYLYSAQPGATANIYKRCANGKLVSDSAAGRPELDAVAEVTGKMTSGSADAFHVFQLRSGSVVGINNSLLGDKVVTNWDGATRLVSGAFIREGKLYRIALEGGSYTGIAVDLPSRVVDIAGDFTTNGFVLSADGKIYQVPAAAAPVEIASGVRVP
jgi:hypothetical protein